VGGGTTKERLRLFSRAMQAGMLAVVVGGLATGNDTWVPAAVISLIVTMIPAALRRDLNLVLPPELNFWIVLALFLHVVGGFSNFYNNVPGWDHLTHMLSASLIGGIAFVLVVIVDKYVTSIYLPPRFLALFIVLLTMAVGVIWEIMEFANDSLFHTQLQYGLDDSMRDLFFDGVAGFVVAFIGARYLRTMTAEHFVETMQIDQVKERLKGIVQRKRES
jgi:hypothetical protein